MIGFLGVMIRPNFIHVKNHGLPFFISGCVGHLWKQAQEKEPRARDRAKSRHHGPCEKEREREKENIPLTPQTA